MKTLTTISAGCLILTWLIGIAMGMGTPAPEVHKNVATQEVVGCVAEYVWLEPEEDACKALAQNDTKVVWEEFEYAPEWVTK